MLLKLLLVGWLAQGCLSGQVGAQDLEPGGKHWTMTNFVFKPSRTLSLTAGGLFSFSENPFRFGFSQTTLGVSKSLDRGYSVGTGYNTIVFRNFVEGRRVFHRIYLKGQKKVEYFGVQARHRVQVQLFVPEVAKYAVRGIYQFKVYWNNRWMPWKAKPYMAHDLMWYAGGKPVVYYGEQGGVEAFQAPLGLHRYRLNLGIYLRPSRSVSLDFFYKRQWEFNTGLAPNREIHLTSGDRSGIVYPFNNFWVWGWSFTYTLRNF